MKRFLAAALVLFHAAHAGESSVTVTYQPLHGLGSGTIHIVPVACHDWYSHSGQPTQIGLISASNVPPTNNPKEATENLNLASACGLRFICGDMGDPKAVPALTLDATGFAIPQRFDHPKEDIARASLECLRRCLPEPLRKTPVSLKCSEADRPWLEKIIAEFNAHDRAQAFFNSKS